MSKYYTNSTGPDTLAFKKAIAKSFALATASGSNQVVMKIYTLDNLDGEITKFFGEKNIKILKKTKKLIVNGITVVLETERTSYSQNTGVAFLPYGTPADVIKAEGTLRYSDIVVAPWTTDELNEFISDSSFTLI